MFLTQRATLVAAMIVSMTLLFVGCGKNVADAPKTKALPKLDFHKPKSFAAAIVRIRELHDAITSDESLPAPISYTVMEVSHSHGEGDAHVHYHLDESGDHDEHDHDHGHDHDHDHGHDDHDHDHGHEHSDPNKHKVTVDVFTELADVVRWLPKIASDGDLPQNEWKQAKSLSEEMTRHLESTLKTDLPSVQRATYKGEASNMDKCIGELESIVTSTDSSQSK